jgi:mono/diheme cytochrome c family protein
MIATRRSVRRVVLIATLTLSTIGVLFADAPPDEEARQEREESRILLQRTVRENCSICHSDEMIASQRLTPKQWKAEVDKMVGWGSPLTKEQQEPVVDFLAAEYPPDAAPARLARLTIAEAAKFDQPEPLAKPVTGDPARGEPLHARNCANCHGPDGQGAELGTNLVEKPVLLRPAEFSEVVKRGRGRMPGFAAILDPSAEADILAWLRTRRYRPVIAPGK